MARKLAVKRLTASDLTFFEWHFRNSASKQKAINLNADIFVEKLYPGLLDPASPRRFPVDLYLYGPGLEGAYNLQRKILKSERAKNWRLNGEIVSNPDDSPRFNTLAGDDFAIFDFNEGLSPESMKIVFIARAIPEDRDIHAYLNQLLAANGMIAISSSDLEDLVTQTTPNKDHPVHILTLNTDVLDSDLEDVVLGGNRGRRRLLSRRTGRRLSREDLQKAKEIADRVGRWGEEYVNEYLTLLQREGRIRSFEWVADDNSISPYDFWVDDGTSKTLIDVKSTQGEFERELHTSLSELQVMGSGPEKYDIYRVFEIKDNTARLRICEDVGAFARNILEALGGFPPGVSLDSVSFSPTLLSVGDTITIELPEEAEE